MSMIAALKNGAQYLTWTIYDGIRCIVLGPLLVLGPTGNAAWHVYLIIEVHILPGAAAAPANAAS